MSAQFQSIKEYGKTLADARRQLFDPALRHADVLLARTVAAVSLLIFGAAGLVAENPGIFVLGLVPIVVFEFLLDR